MRRFKDPSLQEIYRWFLDNDPPPETRGKGGMHNGYYVGRHHPDPDQPWAKRGSPGFAAWAAGIDNARRATKPDHPTPHRRDR